MKLRYATKEAEYWEALAVLEERLPEHGPRRASWKSSVQGHSEAPKSRDGRRRPATRRCRLRPATERRAQQEKRPGTQATRPCPRSAGERRIGRTPGCATTSAKRVRSSTSAARSYWRASRGVEFQGRRDRVVGQSRAARDDTRRPADSGRDAPTDLPLELSSSTFGRITPSPFSGASEWHATPSFPGSPSDANRNAFLMPLPKQQDVEHE